MSKLVSESVRMLGSCKKLMELVQEGAGAGARSRGEAGAEAGADAGAEAAAEAERLMQKPMQIPEDGDWRRECGRNWP